MTDVKEQIEQISPSSPLSDYLTAMESGVDFQNAKRLSKRLFEYVKDKQESIFHGRPYNSQEDSYELLGPLFDSLPDAIKALFICNVFGKYVVITADPTAFTSLNHCNVETIDGKVMIQAGVKTPENMLTISLDNELTHGKDSVDFVQLIENYEKETDIESVNEFNPTDENNPTISSEKVGMHVINDLPQCMVQANTDGSKVLKTAFIPYVNTVDNTNHSDTKPYMLQKIKRKNFFDTDSKYLIVVLLRYTNTQQKIDINIEGLREATIQKNGHTFRSKGCICHIGDTPNVGHYIYVDFENGNSKNVYDDSVICPYNAYVTAAEQANSNFNVEKTGYVVLFEREEAVSGAE